MQRELPAAWSLSADFVYTRGSNLATLVNLNQPLPNAAGNNALGALPYPNFGFIEWRAQNGKSDVQGRGPRAREALRARLRVRRRRTRSASRRTTRPSSSRRRARTRFRRTRATSTSWYGPSDYDVRHRFTRELRLEPAARRQRRSRATGRSPGSTPSAPGVRSPSTRAATTSAPT